MILSRATLVMAMGVWLAALPAQRADAQFEGPSGGFVTPFPENDTYQVLVIGDTLAEGLLGGLLEAISADNRIQLQRRVRTISGLGRPEIDDEIRALEESLGKAPVHVAVVMMGAADRMGMRVGGGGRRLAV
jgi:uncharacterized protein